MKKSLAIPAGLCLLAILLIVGIRATATGEPESHGELLMLADKGSLEEDAAQLALWNGLSGYGGEQNYATKLCLAAEPTQESRFLALENNLSKQSKLLVCFGEAYEPLVYEAQRRYPELNFLLLDGEPRDAEGAVYETRPNTHCLLFRESEAGFLAGYAAVMDGGRTLGFCADRAEPERIRYGYGFIQGADAAAARLGLSSGAIAIRYWYIDGEAEGEVLQRSLVNWYEGGVQTIFVCEESQGAIRREAIAVAELCGGRIIGADADRAAEGEVVCASTVKDYVGQLHAALASLEENGGIWNADRAGRSLRLGVNEGALFLAPDQESWRWERFTPKEHAALLEELGRGVFPLNQAGNSELFPPAPHCMITEQGQA